MGDKSEIDIDINFIVGITRIAKSFRNISDFNSLTLQPLKQGIHIFVSQLRKALPQARTAQNIVDFCDYLAAVEQGEASRIKKQNTAISIPMILNGSPEKDVAVKNGIRHIFCFRTDFLLH